MSEKLRELSEILDGLSGYYQRDTLSPMAIQIYGMALEEYPIETIKMAVRSHISNCESGQYYPKASDLIRNIQGGNLTADQIIGMARNKTCPLGVLARIHIGTGDLDNCNNPFYLKQRAEEVLLMLPEWRKRAMQGDYSDHEISMMLKHNVSAVAPFFAGLAPPVAANEINDRALRIEQSSRHQENIKPAYVPSGDKDQIGTKLSVITQNIASDKRA
tara:strand:+ start:13433 stop:14083 length:651 start_codon:yes stop_codon:yes gene_type:complete